MAIIFKRGWQDEGEQSGILAGVTSMREIMKVRHPVGTSVAQILLDPSCPQIGDFHPHNGLLQIVAIRPRLNISTTLREMEVDWSTDTEDLAADPLQDPWKKSRTTETITEPAEWDDDGYPIQPSNGIEPYDPLPEREVKVRKLVIARNEELWDDAREDEIDPFRGAVNLDTFFGAPAGYVKCDSIDAEEDERNSIKFSRVTYTFLRRKPRLTGVLIRNRLGEDPVRGDVLGWDNVYPDLGSQYLNADSRYVDFVTGYGTPRAVAGRLDGKGKALANGAETVYLRYNLRPKQDFSDLDLGSS